jgi:hypothetical protein
MGVDIGRWTSKLNIAAPFRAIALSRSENMPTGFIHNLDDQGADAMLRQLPDRGFTLSAVSRQCDLRP